MNSEGVHINGSDRESNHSYGDAYARIIENNFSRGPAGSRNIVRLMMEVGVADGSCLLAWREVFPNALIVGMDIHAASRIGWGQLTKDRIEFHLGDQRVREDCERAAAGRQFDLIVEDATHHLPNTLLTLYWLWPFVRPGGLYVVEEWENVDRDRIRALWPQAEIVGTCGPHIQDEPLIVFRKSL